MTESLSDFEVAVAAYQDHCTRNNLIFQQPLEEYSKRINSVLYLRTSATGYIARYDMQRQRLLV